jgi:predicted SnoaL-like aldol condensation-catalyzing enzyme
MKPLDTLKKVEAPMSKLVWRFVIANVLLLLTDQVVIAQAIKVLTEEYPPYNMMVNGQIAGFSTELIKKKKGAEIPSSRTQYQTSLVSAAIASNSTLEEPHNEKCHFRTVNFVCFTGFAPCESRGWLRPS